MYFILLFLVVKLLALYSVKYGLNYLSVYPIKNNPAYATWSATIGNFTFLCLIFSFIWVKNPLSLAFSPLNLLIDGIFILDIPISVILFFNACLLLVSCLMIAYSWPIITTCESVSAILILLTNPKAVAVMGIAFSGILIDLMFLFLL